ncbi:uncharacterized protein E0L32_005238 [Thyridium curvatum]|uniref:DUF6923 domain-containing protein n=1 Tax=Thyridium curvatum TaxID=1093900 RepID=A0A507B621_9PEZI|nr:uncharacterized protein E0L32_005238 [Thyridium curvatum]TPX14546.1 hypothetical protein E0L32_005238 [Thyridium curvatum]
MSPRSLLAIASIATLSGSALGSPAVAARHYTTTALHTPLTTICTGGDDSSSVSTAPTSEPHETQPSSKDYPTTCLPSLGTTLISTVTVTANATCASLSLPIPSTVTITATVTADKNCTAPTSPPALQCDKYGYLIQHADLIRVDLETGSIKNIAQKIGDGSDINGMGYNPLDNYLYARQGGKNMLVRIASDGTLTEVMKMPTNVGEYCGDIDDDGYYWYSTGGADWQQMDLRPGSPTYGKLLGSGKFAAGGYRALADWVFLPSRGRYLYGFSRATGSGRGTDLVRFGMDTHRFETVRNYPTLSGGFGAAYGMDDGRNATLFASDNSSGFIWKIELAADGTTGQPIKSANGPKTSSNDGARCVRNIL